MGDRSVKEQVLSGLSITVKALAAFATIATFWAAIIAVTSPERVRPESFLLRRWALGTHSFIVAWICLAVATAILVLTMDRWVKILPGFFFSATVIPLIMLSGRRYHGVPVPWNVGWSLLFFTISAAIISLTFQERRLHVIDRVALMVFLFCLGIGMTPNVSTMFTALGIGFAFLVLAWAVDRFLRRRRRNSSNPHLYNSATDGADRH